MADIIKKIKIGSDEYDLRDATAARASDLQAKQDALTAGNGIAIDSSDIIRTTGIPFGVVDETSTSTAYTVTVPGIYTLEEGVCCLVKNGKVTSESGFTLNVNGLGAKPSYSNMATGNTHTPTASTRDTTIFNINYTMLFIYTTSLHDVPTGAWICYRGYDANTNTIGYQLRHNSSTLPASDKFYRYRLLFTSADGTKYVPANTSTSTNGTASRTVNLRPIDPFGEIVYYSSTSAVNAGANPAATVLWDEYVLNLGYSFNRTGAALVLTYPKPVYIKCAHQTNGSAIIDADAPYVQNLPSSVDVDHIYIFLGIAYSATNIELLPNHPVYYHDGTGIRIWTGKNITKVSELTNDSGFITSSSLNGLASTSYVDTKVAGVVNSAPETLDTLNELATALGNDPNFATTITTQLGNKVDKETGKSLMTDAERTKLQGIAAGAEVNVQPNWTQTNTSADDYIKNKPNLATVATSGSYDDLSDKPIYLVTLSIDNNDQLTSDKDYDEISEAIQDGKLVIVEFSQSMPEGLSAKQSFRYSALISLQDGDAIGFIALGVKYGSSITTLACSKSNTETIWNIGNIIIPAGVRLSGSTYNTNVSDGYIRLDDVLPTVAITGSYNDLTNKPTIPTSADIDAAKPFIITITSTYGEHTTYSADKTFAEITSAYDDGRELLVNCENYYYNLKHVSDNKTLFDFELIDSENRVSQVFTITTQSITYEEYYYQSPLTFDNLPTANSNNPVKSGGVYSALQGKEDRQVEIINLYYNGNEPTWTNSSGNSMNIVQVNTLLRNSSKNVIIKATLVNVGIDGVRLYYRTSPLDDSYIIFHTLELNRIYWLCFDADVSDYSYLSLDEIGVADISSYVPKTRKINNKSLSSDITLNASDVGAQATLVSGTNIKTINNTSLLGSGDITIETDTTSIDYNSTNTALVIDENGSGSTNTYLKCQLCASEAAYNAITTKDNDTLYLIPESNA